MGIKGRMHYPAGEKRIRRSTGGARLWLLLGVVLVLAAGLAGCKKDPRLSFIQGVWFYKDEHLKNFPGESAQVTNWEFDNGYFSVYSCCFTEVNFSGYYSATEREGDQLNLELFNLEGQNGSMALRKNDTATITVEIDPDSDTLMINGDGPYSRFSP
jgi:hypothetical protein